MQQSKKMFIVLNIGLIFFKQNINYSQKCLWDSPTYRSCFFFFCDRKVKSEISKLFSYSSLSNKKVYVSDYISILNSRGHMVYKVSIGSYGSETRQSIFFLINGSWMSKPVHVIWWNKKHLVWHPWLLRHKWP